MKPIQFDPRQEKIEDFMQRLEMREVLDYYGAMLKELFLVRNPQYRFNPNYETELAAFIKDHAGGKPLEEAGNWFYFPWNKLLAHYLPDAMHQELRTARNKNLITADEQAKFYNFNVGVAGLSVGSHAALTLAMMGGGRVVKLADPDEISGSNLNRIRFGFTRVGENKCDVVTQEITQMNPYSEIHSYPQGVTPDGLPEFFAGPPKLGVMIELVDNLEMKIRIREEAKKQRIPVIMATDNGDNVIVDVERYDLDPQPKIFNGAAGDLTLEEFQKFPPQDLPRLASKIAGPGMVVPRMLGSVLEVGKTLYSWPQLGDAATLSGVAIAYLVRRLALGQKVASGRLEVNLDSIFDPDYSSPEAAGERDKQRKDFLAKIGL